MNIFTSVFTIALTVPMAPLRWPTIRHTRYGRTSHRDDAQPLAGRRFRYQHKNNTPQMMRSVVKLRVDFAAILAAPASLFQAFKGSNTLAPVRIPCQSSKLNQTAT